MSTWITIARSLADFIRALAGLDDEDARAKRLRDRAARDLEADARRAKRAAARVKLRSDE